MSEHTPGPWYANGDCIEAAGEEGPRDRTLAVVHGTEREANARLIAAAPNLLEVMRKAKSKLIDLYEVTYPNSEPVNELTAVIDMMIAAINRAEGRGE